MKNVELHSLFIRHQSFLQDESSFVMESKDMIKLKIQKYRVKGQGSSPPAPCSLTLAPFLFLLFSFFILNFPVLAAWFGLDGCPLHWNYSTGYADAQRFQAPEDGTSTRLEIRTWTSTKGSTFRMAVYDDDNGRPKNKLWEGADITYVGGAWCGEDVTTIQLTEGSYYWFAFKTSASEEMCYVAGGPTNSHEWKSGQTYADTFPNPWGSYTGHNSNRYTMRMHYTTEEGTKGIIEIDAGIIEGGIIR